MRRSIIIPLLTDFDIITFITGWPLASPFYDGLVFVVYVWILCLTDHCINKPMKRILTLMGLAIAAHLGAAAQNNNNVTTPNGYNSTINPVTPVNTKPGNVDPNYDHSPTYNQVESNTDPHVHYKKLDDSPAPVNNTNNNNTMTPYNNTSNPYEITSPYYTPPNVNAPQNNIPPER